MSDAQKALLVSWLGKTKTSARRVMSAYLKTVREGVRLEDDERLQALSQFHPSRRFPPNTVFVLRRCEPYFTLALYVVAKTGGYLDFSWIKCVENLYGKYDRNRVRRDNTHSALRNEAFNSDAIVSFTWANTCSAMRVDEFDGGAVVITKEGADYLSPVRWIDAKIAEITAARATVAT